MAALLLLTALPQANAGELLAQAIGQPPEQPAPAEPPAPARTPPPAAPGAEDQEAAAAGPRDELKTRILIGAGLALALGVLAGGGGGGDTPAGGETVPEHF